MTVWTTPLSPSVPVSLPVTYKAGVSTKIDGACVNVLDANGKTISAWGAGSWQRAEIS